MKGIVTLDDIVDVVREEATEDIQKIGGTAVLDAPYLQIDPQNPDFADKRWYPRRFYHDIRFATDVGPKFNFYMGVDNLTDEQPPYATTGIGGGSSIYDAIGRFFYAGVKANF